MDSKDFRVSVVIPNFNGQGLLLKNLPRVLTSKRFSQNQILEIIVVDDASTDKSVRIIKRKFFEVKLIKHRMNRGFPAAVNTGARSAKGDLIALINTDVVPEKDFLVSVLPHFEDENVFAVSLHEKGYGWAKGFFKDGFVAHSPVKEDENVHETFWVSGGSGVFRRSQWIKFGGMDEKLFSPFYWEDLDLCFRAAKRGLKLLWEPKARVFHEHESTIGKLPKPDVQMIMERNQLLFIWKNLTSPILFRKHIWGLAERIGKSPGYIKILFLALLKIGYIKKARAKEKKESKISDEAILTKFTR